MMDLETRTVSLAVEDAQGDFGLPFLLKVLCPICRDCYVHIGRVEIRCEEYTSWDGRGDAVHIPFWGECGHRWVLVVGHHKGQTFLKQELGGDDPEGCRTYVDLR